MRSVRAGGIAVLMLGCTGTADDTGAAELPPADSGGWREDTGTFPFDTSDSGGGDETPPHLLTARQEGSWVLGGPSADPNSVTGTLVITEVLDGDTLAPACSETWALVGARAEADCPGCDYTFVVQHTQTALEGACRMPERPADGEERALGYGDGVIWWDWYDTGVWVPLWDATLNDTRDELAFQWETTVGVEVEEE